MILSILINQVQSVFNIQYNFLIPPRRVVVFVGSFISAEPLKTISESLRTTSESFVVVSILIVFFLAATETLDLLT